MRIGVSGASGQLGRKVVSYLLKRGGSHSLVGVSRSPQTVAAPVEGRYGDYDVPDSMLRAYERLDRLLIIPSADLRPGVRGNQFRAAIDAARQAGVQHIFLISSVGTREENDPGLGAAYWAGEQHLIKTVSHWTILRMNYYAESMADEIKMSLAGGALAGLGDERVAYVSRDDLAAAAAGALLGEGHVGATYNVTGPVAVTGSERAAIVSDIVGKPINYVAITAEQLRAALAQAQLPEPVVDMMVDIKTRFVEGKYDIVTGDAERLFGHPPKTLRDVLAAELA